MKKKSPKPLPDLGLILSGAAIGAANALPGVSGGTIAVLTGIYDRLISAVSGFFSNEYGWRKNLLYLIQVALGLGLGIIAFAHLIDWFFIRVPEQTTFWFIGLIAGSLPYLVRIAKPRQFRWYHGVVFLVTLGLMVLLSLQPQPAEADAMRALTIESALGIFAAGIIASAAMVIPGISGSFILLILGLYSTFITAIKEMNIPMLLVLVLGGAIGIVGVSKLIGFLLKRYHSITYAGIIGLVIGSLFELWPGFSLDWTGLASLGAFLFGLALALLLGKPRGGQGALESPKTEGPVGE
jgi:putative membrane protein